MHKNERDRFSGGGRVRENTGTCMFRALASYGIALEDKVIPRAADYRLCSKEDDGRGGVVVP